MLEIMQSVCRKCEKVYPLVAGATCPECESQLFVVSFVEAFYEPPALDETFYCRPQFHFIIDGVCVHCGYREKDTP